jgi:hypothetical protein
MRGRSIVWVVGLVLLGAIGVLWAISNAGLKPEEIKAELSAKIEELNSLPAEEIVRKDALAHGYLANDQYKDHAKALWLRLEKAHRSLHDAAQLDQAAQKETTRFLGRSKDLSKTEREDLKLLLGEVRTLIDKYGATRFGDALRKRQDDLTAKLDSLPKEVTPLDFLELSKKATTAQAQGHFSEALDLIDAWTKRPGAKEYAQKVAPLVESTNSKAEAAAEAMLERAKMHSGRGDKTAALGLLERSEPDFRRYPKALGEIEALRRTIRSR